VITRIPEPTPCSRTAEDRSAEETTAWLRLGKAELPPRKLAALLDLCGHDPRAVLEAPEAVRQDCGIAASQAQRLRECESLDVSRDISALERLGGAIVTIYDEQYPARLRTLPDAPAMLYVRGALSADDQFSVAIVGSRRATAYGHSIAERFARELCAYGLCIVSGGARGVDSHAHRGALGAGGRTVAIVGCGLDVAYPAENRKLYTDMVTTGQGVIVSEYPIGVTPEPWRFPARNRLISGISLGVLVVESPVGSGAMITANDAAEQGRDVFAVPGPIESGRSAGCHRLIQEGAKLVQRPEDIIDELGLLRLTADGEDSASRLPLMTPTAGLAPDQRKVLDQLSLEAANVDQIAIRSGLPTSSVTALLTMLEMRGLARRVPGNGFVRVL
jgi:DNA processing protein